MNKLSVLCFFLVSSPGIAEAQELSPAEASGKVVYDKWCEPCHGRVAGGLHGGFGANDLAGTSALGVKYKGNLPAVLEDRTDLSPIFISTIVRNGLYGMPITRITEVSDADLENIIAYLTRSR